MTHSDGLGRRPGMKLRGHFHTGGMTDIADLDLERTIRRLVEGLRNNDPWAIRTADLLEDLYAKKLKREAAHVSASTQNERRTLHGHT